MDQNQNEEAIKYNYKITKNHPNDPRGFINNAVMAMSSKKPDQAIQALQPHVNKFFTRFYNAISAGYSLLPNKGF